MLAMAMTAALALAAPAERPACMDLPWTCPPRVERMRMMPVRGCRWVEAERWRRVARFNAELERARRYHEYAPAAILGFARGVRLEYWQQLYGRCQKVLAWGFPRY